MASISTKLTFSHLDGTSLSTSSGIASRCRRPDRINSSQIWSSETPRSSCSRRLSLLGCVRPGEKAGVNKVGRIEDSDGERVLGVLTSVGEPSG